MALTDYCRNVFGPKTFGDLSLVVIQATFASGVATRDASNSSPDTTCTGNSGGVYAITFPACQFVHVVGCQLDNKDATPDGADAHVAVPISISAAGTGSIATLATDDGLVADPDDTARLFVTLLCGSN